MVCYGKSNSGVNKSMGYVDFDIVVDLDKKKSIISYFFTLNNCVISWKASL